MKMVASDPVNPGELSLQGVNGTVYLEIHNGGDFGNSTVEMTLEEAKELGGALDLLIRMQESKE